MRWRDFRASALEQDNPPPSEGSRISTAKPWLSCAAGTSCSDPSQPLLSLGMGRHGRRGDGRDPRVEVPDGECVEGEFLEVELPIYGILERSSDIRLEGGGAARDAPSRRKVLHISLYFYPKAPLLCPKQAGPARWGVRGLRRGCRRLGSSLHSCSLRGSRPAPRLGEPPHGRLLDLAPNGWRGGGDLVVRCVPEWGVSTGCVRRNVHPGTEQHPGLWG